MKVLTGDTLVRMAHEWIELNPVPWSYIVAEALKAARNRKRTSIAKLVEEARYTMRVEGIGDGFKINNSIRAVLSRILIAAYPEVGEVMECRKSKADRVANAS